MVEPDRPSSDGAGEPDAGDRPSPAAGNSRPAGQGPFHAALDYFGANKMEAALMATRFTTLLFAMLYIVPFAGGSSCFR